MDLIQHRIMYGFRGWRIFNSFSIIQHGRSNMADLISILNFSKLIQNLFKGFYVIQYGGPKKQKTKNSVSTVLYHSY